MTLTIDSAFALLGGVARARRRELSAGDDLAAARRGDARRRADRASAERWAARRRALELIALETLPFGASRYPEWGSASVVGGAIFASQPRRCDERAAVRDARRAGHGVGRRVDAWCSCGS